MSYKILVADDEEDIVRVFESRLSREGYDVSTAFDGEEALQKVIAHNPDIILLDLIMPKLHGFEVLREIREKHNDRWRPVIIISAKSELDSIRKGYELEADHYLTKPCPLDKVLQAVRTMISLIPSRNSE